MVQGNLKGCGKTHKTHAAPQTLVTDHLPKSVLEQLKIFIFEGGTHCATQHASFCPDFLFFMQCSLF